MIFLLFVLFYWVYSQASLPSIREIKEGLFERVNTFFEFFSIIFQWPSFNDPKRIRIRYWNTSLEYAIENVH